MRDRRGVALIEVLVALVLLASSGIALALLLGQTLQTMRVVRASERVARAAANELTRLSALDRRALEQLEGRQTSHGFVLDVHERRPGLFDASVAPNDSAPPLLTTTVYRPPL
jgi:type II secretory pathway component PulJ